VLKRNVEWLKAHPTTRFTIEGYADPRGTNEYNLALGERRADTVRRFLIVVGIEPDRLAIVTRGRTQAFCPEPTEACWAQNRRAHFVFVAK
jgi:peptidoglycan-associated lipoprotein